MARTCSLDAVRPTQLYLSSEKLADVIEWFDFDDPNYGTLPVFEHDGECYLSDGHTRAFVAFLAGETRLRIERDESLREEYDFEVYRAAISWCADAGVDTVADLRGRIVEPETFRTVWLDRCHDVSSE